MQSCQDTDSVGDRARWRVQRHEEHATFARADRFAVGDRDLPGSALGARVVRDPSEGLADVVVGDAQADGERALGWQRAELALDAPCATGGNAKRGVARVFVK